MNQLRLQLQSLSTCMILFFSGATAMAQATCENDLLGSNGRVIVADNQEIVVSGLNQEGIVSGTYTCRVLGVGPGILSTQSQLECDKATAPVAKLSAWMIQGLDALGRPAASVALYDTNGRKIFESPCSRD